MSFLRLLRSSRPSNPFHSLRPSRSNTPSPKTPRYFQPNPIGLTRSRFYSFYQKPNQHTANNKRFLYGMMGINIAVFGYGAYAHTLATSGHPDRYISFTRNMSCNLTDVLQRGSWHTLLTSTFSHVDFWHLACNMVGAYALGGFLCTLPVITPGRFLAISLGSGLTGSLGYLVQRYLMTGGSGIDFNRGLGFSGALTGIMSVAACLSPRTTFSIYGIVPVPLWGLALGYAFYDGYYLNDSKSRVGHAGHLGGALFGVMYYVLRLRGLRV